MSVVGHEQDMGPAHSTWMIPFPERPWVAFCLVLPIIVIWCWALLDDSHPTLLGLLFVLDASSRRPTDAQFITQAAAVEFPSPIDYAPIQQACARNGGFRDGLLFTCEGQHGGVGMVRNQILKCVRYAMHAGAAIVVPSMSKRNPKDISDIETIYEAPLEYLFDRHAFVNHLTAACPGMRVYDSEDQFPHYSDRVPENLTIVGDQFDPEHPPEGIRQPREWRHSFEGWLDGQGVQVSPQKPVHVKIDQAFLEYPVRDDGREFANEYGKILSFRHETRDLAARVLLEMRNKFNLPIDPSRPINPDTYYGAHLRLEKDAVEAWAPEDGWRFSNMEDQFQEQFKNLARFPGLDVVYVASGNLTVVDLFRQELARRVEVDSSSTDKPGPYRGRNITVVTKHDLLPDKTVIDSLPFDQQGLVDFLVMFRASAFMGVGHSSFPWNVALRRHELSRYESIANEGTDLLRDELSVIMGKRSDYHHIDPFATGLWP
ncbi:hypothetical protein ACKVWM_007438 [Pyricularia oryzae]|nr:hypothetical protein MCOR06_000444 [Pyricularia oryzae]